MGKPRGFQGAFLKNNTQSYVLINICIFATLFCIITFLIEIHQEGRGHWTVNYIGTNIYLIRCFKNFGYFYKIVIVPILIVSTLFNWFITRMMSVRTADRPSNTGSAVSEILCYGQKKLTIFYNRIG